MIDVFISMHESHSQMQKLPNIICTRDSLEATKRSEHGLRV